METLQVGQTILAAQFAASGIRVIKIVFQSTRYIATFLILNPFTADPIKALHFAILV